MNSPKSDSNKSNPSSRKRKLRNSKNIDEMGPVTPITRFFEKSTQMRHRPQTDGRIKKQTDQVTFSLLELLIAAKKDDFVLTYIIWGVK